MFGIFITARCGSTRLTRKHFRKINGKFVLLYLIERISNEFSFELEESKCEICIVSGNKHDNHELDLFENEKFVQVFYGSDQNIPLRHYQCAKQKNYSYIISLDGDDILSSTKGMRAVQIELNQGQVYAGTEGLPFGMNVNGYSTEFLGKSLEGSHHKVLENGWGRIFPLEAKSRIIYEPEKGIFRLTLDYPEDLVFFSRLINLTDDYIKADYTEFTAIIKLNRLMEINSHLIDDYWKSFREKEKSEILNESKK